MNSLLNNLSIRARMALSVAFFFATLCYAMYGSYSAVDAPIAFATQEKKGNAYQRPLATLLHDTAILRLTLAAARTGRGAGVPEAVAKIDEGMKALEEVHGRFGADLQFTEQGLGSRDRAHLQYAAVKQKWHEAKAAVLPAPGAPGNDAAVAGVVADLRGMVAHSGDTSNLILDPDLDSYYLMDITLLALPQTIDRLGVVGAAFLPRLSEPRLLSEQERTEAAVMAATLRESDIARVVADADTSLKEDANFYGEKEGLKDKLPPLLTAFREKNDAVAALLGQMGAGAPVAPATLAAALGGALAADRALLADGYDELDGMIDARIGSHEAKQDGALVIAVGGILISVLSFMLISQSVTDPLRALIAAMERLARNDLSAEVPWQGAKSEAGKIAAALEVFKRNALEKQAMEAHQKEAETRSRAERHEAMQRVAQNFETRVKGIVDAVAEAAAGLSDTAQDMAGFIAQSTAKSGEASNGANVTSQNMQSVAAAADEMAATIREISVQVQRTNQFIADSVQKAAGASTHAAALQEASRRVRDVTRLIAEIAGQTNLLALNATIEAARAGEAGKGFAVVATEVKNLASQTDKSIQDIEQVIAEMSAATDGVVSSLGAIKVSVDKIYETSTGIASAVEEQSVTVNDIVKNMQTASDGTVKVSQNIRIVASLSDEASQSSQQVLVAANDLNKRAEQLDMEVATFLSEVRE